MSAFRLRFPLKELQRWVGAYTDLGADAEPVAIGATARTRGFLTRAQFLTIAHWKSPRPMKHYERNPDDTVREVTRFAFSTRVEPLRLRALTLLRGIQPRSASAILHLCHPDPYPMMDVRALWSLGIDSEPDDWGAIWPEYVVACRRLAQAARVDMRTLDRALWGYSVTRGAFAGQAREGTSARR